MRASFQLIFILLFMGAAVFGILVFSGAIKIGDTKGQAAGTVVLWGTIKSEVLAPLITDFNDQNKAFSVTYVEKSPETFDQDLLEALASGKGPDLYFLPDDLAFHYSNKLVVIPYQSYSLTAFKNAFAGAGDVFLSKSGILAFPMTIDPLMMYYNRSVLDSNGVVYPPVIWDDLSGAVRAMTKKDNTDKILTSAVALGHYSNVAHAKDILAAMFMQLGDPIVREEDGVLHTSLQTKNGRYDLSPVLQFYTDFANPSKSVYSWNKSFSNSTTAFSGEEVALYFGFASELEPLVNKNPNQNLGVAPFPQFKGTSTKVTLGRVMGLAISSFSKNPTTAFTAASLMATGNFASKLSTALSIPPARRDLLAVKPADAFSPIFYNSALYAKSWLDPSDQGTNDIFRTMIDSVLSNTRTPQDAVEDARAKLELLLFK